MKHFYIILLLFFYSCANVKEDIDITVESSVGSIEQKSMSEKFEDKLLELKKGYLKNCEPWIDLLVIPLETKDSIQSIQLVKGVYLPSENYVFNGCYHDGERRIIFLNLEESVFNIVEKNKLKSLNSVDDFEFSDAVTPVFKYINIYGSDSLVISDSSI